MASRADLPTVFVRRRLEAPDPIVPDNEHLSYVRNQMKNSTGKNHPSLRSPSLSTHVCMHVHALYECLQSGCIRDYLPR